MERMTKLDKLGAVLMGLALFIWCCPKFMDPPEANAQNPYSSVWTATAVNVSGSTKPALFTPGSGMTVTLKGVCLTGSAAGVITLLNGGSSGSVVLAVPTAAGGQCSMIDLGMSAVSLGSPGSTLNMALSVSGSISGTAWGTQQ